MGLFSFFKKSGQKVFKEEPAGKTPAEVQKDRKKALEKALFTLDLPIENLVVDLQDDTAVVMGTAKSQADREKAILALGNVDGIAAVDDRITVEKPEPESVFYEVKPGDSLSKIAKAHYGDAMKYMKIFEANQPMLKNPDLIYPGQKLRIPPLEG